MPERAPTRNPTVMAGTPLESGVPNTGQLMYTTGGSRVYSRYSGTVGGDVNIWTGGGRIDSAFVHDSAMIALSGIAIVFYDTAVVTSGGPFAASGHRIVGTLAPAAITGISGAALRGGAVIPMGFSFSSGLTHTGASGQPGFSVSYTPVVSG